MFERCITLDIQGLEASPGGHYQQAMTSFIPYVGTVSVAVSGPGAISASTLVPPSVSRLYKGNIYSILYF